MKIIYKVGNLRDAEELIILHGCNAQGVMRSGVAKVVREKWPEAYNEYRAAFENYGLSMGDTVIAFSRGKKIINAITQEYFGRDGKQYVDYEAIRTAIRSVNKLADVVAVAVVAMPKIGAGLGGGDWNIISKIIEEESTNFQPVVYELSD